MHSRVHLRLHHHISLIHALLEADSMGNRRLNVGCPSTATSGLEALRLVLLHVVSRDDRSVQHDPLRNFDLYQV